MIDIVLNFLEKYDIKNQKIGLAFSAGPDSCALAYILNELKEKLNLQIVLCYFNHKWRKEAVLEEEFTKNLAQKFNFEYTIGKMPDNITKTEEFAREERYKFFEKVLKSFNMNYMLLGHNKDDNAETIIYRLIKGTSIKGLCAIKEKRGCYLRPLLEISKEEILNFLKENSQKYMIDISNNDTKYMRNFIRKEILPLFSKINPNYLNSIHNFSKTCLQAQFMIDEMMSKVYQDLILDDVIQKNKYIKLDISYRLEFLNSFLGHKLKYRDYKTLKKLDDFILNNITSMTSLNSKEFLKVRKDKIYIVETNVYDK